MGHEDSSPCSQELANAPHFEQNESRPKAQTVFLSY
jgi:hypothetical protein